jgi:molecular chaperone DnaK
VKTVGIDLGTTYSSISWYDEENDRVLTVDLVNTADGLKIIRSVIYFPQGGEPVVGETAWNMARANPDRVAVGIKRAMGTDYKFGPVDGKTFTPQEVSAEILKVLVREAEAYLGDKVTDAVITVPAYFGDNERKATEEAGRLAGLNVLGLMAEPHAAALAYVVEKAAEITEKYLLVYDLGGGTFDITLIHAKSLSQQITGASRDKEFPTLAMTTLCKEGNSSLGGLDWDRSLAKLVTEKVKEQHNVDIDENDAFLLDSCEKAKRHLGRVTSISVVGDVAGHAVEVSRQEFEERTAGLLFQSECLVEQALKDAIPVFQERARTNGADPDKVDLASIKSQITVMLTGGSSKMPMVKEMLKRVTGADPMQYGNPELLVTIGAAYYAHLLKSGLSATAPVQPIPNPNTGNGGQQSASPASPVPPRGGVVIIDTTAKSLGIAALRRTGNDGFSEVYAEVLPKNSRYGTSQNKDFEKVEDNMTEIEIVLYESESGDLSSSPQVATFKIEGLPPGGRKGEIVRVQIGCDLSGFLRGSALDIKSGKSAHVEIDRPF